MSVPATWGITSLQFLILYGALCVLLRCANIVAWSAVERTAADGEEWPAVDAYDLAMVNGGPRQAITTALTMLMWRGAIAPGSQPTLVHGVGDLGAGADALERAVYEDIGRAGHIDTRALRHAPATRHALERIRLGLTHDGLLVDPRHTAWTGRLWLWGPVVLFIFGSVRLVAMWQYIDANTTMRLLLFTTLGVGIVALSHANDQRRYDGRPLPSARGRSLVEQWRTEDRATIESQHERIALATALADDEDWDPSRVPTRAAAASPPGGDPPTENRPVPTPPDGPADALLAEDLLLLVCVQARDADPDPTLCSRLAAALLIELGFRGNVGVEITPDGEEAIFVNNEAATGDELLDEALQLLVSTSRQSTPTPSSERLWGLAARRRLRSRGRVRDRDIVSWWWGSWRCAEFPQLTPTVVQQILTLCEELHEIPHRVARRLVARGVLREQLAGRWPFELRDQTLHNRNSSEIPGLHTGTRDRLLEALTTDGWRHTQPPGDVPSHANAATRAVELIAQKYHEATDI